MIQKWWGSRRPTPVLNLGVMVWGLGRTARGLWVSGRHIPRGLFLKHGKMQACVDLLAWLLYWAVYFLLPHQPGTSWNVAEKGLRISVGLPDAPSSQVSFSFITLGLQTLKCFLSLPVLTHLKTGGTSVTVLTAWQFLIKSKFRKAGFTWFMVYSPITVGKAWWQGAWRGQSRCIHIRKQKRKDCWPSTRFSFLVNLAPQAVA